MELRIKNLTFLLKSTFYTVNPEIRTVSCTAANCTVQTVDEPTRWGHTNGRVSQTDDTRHSCHHKPGAIHSAHRWLSDGGECVVP